MVVNELIKFEDITDEVMLELAFSNQLLYEALVTKKFGLIQIERRQDWWSEEYLVINGKQYLPSTINSGERCLITVFNDELFSLTYDQEMLEEIN